jgi:hypothetical protein
MSRERILYSVCSLFDLSTLYQLQSLYSKSHDSLVGIVIRLRAAQSGIRVRYPGIFLFTTASRPALGPIQPPILCVPEDPSMGVKRPGGEADHSPPTSAKVNNAWNYTSITPIHLQGVGLVKHRDNFTFTFNVKLPYRI